MNHQASTAGKAAKPVMTAFAIFLFYLPVSGWSSPHLRVNCDSSIMPSYVWNVKLMPQQEVVLVLAKYTIL